MMTYNLYIASHDARVPELPMYAAFGHEPLAIEAVHYLFGTDRDDIKRTHPHFTQDQIQTALHSQVFFDNQLENITWQIVNLSQHMNEAGDYIFDDGQPRDGYRLAMSPERYSFLQQPADVLAQAIKSHVTQNQATGELDCDEPVIADLIDVLSGFNSPFDDDGECFASTEPMTRFQLLNLFNQVLYIQTAGETACVSLA